MNLIINLVIALARVIFPAMLDSAKPEHIEAKSQPKLKKQLRKQIMGKWYVALALLFVICASGCKLFTRTIYVPHGEPVKLAQPLKGVAVWVMTPDGQVLTQMDIPEGWYCLPLDNSDDDIAEEGLLPEMNPGACYKQNWADIR